MKQPKRKKRQLSLVESRSWVDDELNDTQKEVLSMLTIDCMTPIAIATKLGIRPQAVYKIIKQLRNLGFINGNNTSLIPPRTTSQPFNHIRIHSIAISVDIINTSATYERIRKEGDSNYRWGHSVHLYENKIMIYLKNAYFGNTVHVAMHKVCQDILKILCIIEYDMKILLSKPRKYNISIVEAHCASVNNPVAMYFITKGIPIEVLSDKDGKRVLICDCSERNFELETVHPKDCLVHMERIHNFFKDVINPEFEGLLNNQNSLNNSKDDVLKLTLKVDLLTKVLADLTLKVDSLIKELHDFKMQFRYY